MVIPIKRLLAGYQLEPEEVEILTAAFNRALRSLGVVDRNELTELIASEITEISATGVRDPVEICKIATGSGLQPYSAKQSWKRKQKKRMPFARTWRASGN